MIDSTAYFVNLLKEIDKPTGKASGGFARAKVLSPERRSEIAKKAAITRWQNKEVKQKRENRMDIFAERLKEARLLRKMEQKDFPNINATMISHLEKGRRKPSVTTLIQLSLALNVSCDYLCGLTEDFRLIFNENSIIYRKIQELTDDNLEIVIGIIDMLLNKQK